MTTEGAHLLDLRGIGVDYAGKPVLRDVDFVARAGEITALLGPNGSGKTTLLRCAAAIERPTRGTVHVAGIDAGADERAAKAKLGFGVDPAKLPDALTGRQALELFAGVRRLGAIPDATFALADALAFRPWLDHEVATYSLGTRQKLGILLGLLGEPPLVLLDEPVNGLDPTSAHALKRHLAERARQGAAVVIATHALESAERHAHRVVLLVDGRIAHEWPPDVLAALRADPTRSLEDEMIAAIAPENSRC